MKKVLAAGLLLAFTLAGASTTIAMAQDATQMQQQDTTKAKKKHHKEHKEWKHKEKKGMEKTDTTSTGGGAQK